MMDSINKLDSLVNAKKISNNHQATIYAKMALSIALRMNSEKLLARAYLMMGVPYFNNNKDSSFFYYSNALKVAERYNLDEIKPRIYYSLAMIYSAASDLKMAVIFLDSSIIISQKVKNYSSLSNTYNVLGNLKSDMLDSIDAKAMYDSAYNIANRHNLLKQKGIAMASLSRFETDQASYVLQKKAIQILEKQSGNEEEIASILSNLGLRSSNPDTAIKYYKSAIRFAQSGNCSELEIASYNNLAYSCLDKKDFKEAEMCLVNHAIPIATRIGNYDWLSTLYDSYTDVLIAEKKMVEGLSYARKALNYRVLADKKMASDQVLLLAALLDVKNKELRIQTNEKELEKKENKIQMVTLWFSISLLGVLIVLFFIIWTSQRNRIKFRTEQFESAKRLIESEENMKGRVSMELHDLATPFYTTMRQHIEEAHIKDHKIEKQLKDKLSIMTTNIRQISHRMNNNFIEQLNIAELVKGLCEDLNGSTNIPIHCDIGQENFNFSGEETIHIYRIIQEILTNAVKHVSFGEISLSLSEEAGMLFILYNDTGSGFDDKTYFKKGLGIVNIFERAKIIGGKAVLITAVGNGTKWNISIPLKKVNILNK